METQSQNIPQFLSNLLPSQEKVETAIEPTWASVYGFELPRDEQIAIHLLQGKSRNKVAGLMDLAPATVYNIVQTPLFTRCFHQMQKECRENAIERKERIEVLAGQGIDRIADVLYNSDDADLVVKTGLAMIDRAGHAVKQHVQVDKTIVHIDREMSECIEAAFRELKDVENALGEVNAL